MVASVDNIIRVYEPSEELVRWCEDHLTLPNPEYYKKERMGLWVGRTPKTISLWRVEKQYGDSISIPTEKLPHCDGEGRSALHTIQMQKFLPYALEIPFGVFRDVKDMLGDVYVGFFDAEDVDYGDAIPLYDYQYEAVEAAYRARYGILQAPAGCGKTQMGLALIQRYGVKALWLTHTKDLLNQSKKRAERYMDKNLMGTITEGKVDIGKGITFATVQTMSKMDLREYSDSFGVIICDECHRVCCSATGVAMFEKVLNSLSCGHKYGLSATVHRADGLIRATFALLGRVVYTVPETAVEALVEPVSVCTVQTDAVIPEEAIKDDGSIVWAKLINGLCADSGRNGLIVDELIKNYGHSCLILSDRLGHLETLMAMLPDDMRQDAVMISGKMTSKKGKAEREAAIEQMRTGKKKYLFATYTLAKEGLDVPRLERLFLTTPQKDEAVIIQSLGRIARKFEGKAKPVCIDFVDGKIGIMVGMWKKRMRIYRQKGVEM